MGWGVQANLLGISGEMTPSTEGKSPGEGYEQLTLGDGESWSESFCLVNRAWQSTESGQHTHIEHVYCKVCSYQLYYLDRS